VNARAPISGNLPVEAALRLYDAADLQRAEPTDEDLDFAKCDIVMEIEHGKTIGGMDLEACLDCELNQTETGQSFIRELATVLLNPYDPAESAASYRLKIVAWLDKVVAAHIPESAITERAYEDKEAA